MSATTLILLVLLVALRPSSCQNISSIQPEIPVRVLPGDTRLNTFTFLTCLPEPSTLTQSDYVSRWTIPSGVTITSMINLPGFERFRVSQGAVNTPQGDRQSTLLIVLNLTYQDAGTYTCEVRSSSAPAQSPWLSASVELQLEVGVQANVSNVTAHISDSEVELGCEMTLYIRPDEDLQWFRGSEMIVSRTNRCTVSYRTNRYTISYRSGSARGAQNGGDTLIPGRVSVLTISSPQLSDSGTYTCRILGTEQSAEIQFSVEGTFTATPTHSVTTRTPPMTATTTPVQSATPMSPGATLSTATTTPSAPTPIQSTFSAAITSAQNTFPAIPTPSVTATTRPAQSVTPRDPGATLSTEIVGVLVAIGLIILAMIAIATIVIIAVVVKQKTTGKSPNYCSKKCADYIHRLLHQEGSGRQSVYL